jgi:hypothetical protein
MTNYVRFAPQFAIFDQPEGFATQEKCKVTSGNIENGTNWSPWTMAIDQMSKTGVQKIRRNVLEDSFS